MEVNLCQKLLFLHQLTQIVHWIPSSVHENCKLRTCWEHVENILWAQIVFCFCSSEKDLPVVQCWWGLLCSAELPTESKCDWNGSWLFPKLPRLALPPFPVRDWKLLKPEPEPEPVVFRPVECPQASGQSESIVDTCSVCGINVTTRFALAFLDRLFRQE